MPTRDGLLIRETKFRRNPPGAGLIGAFLEHLEDDRKNAPVTRNVRLAAIKSFYRFLEYRQPAALTHRFAPPLSTTRQRPAPSLWRPGFETVATERTVSL